MIPLFHDFTDETVLVFGGGPVGARKARRFDREAHVLVLSPTFDVSDFGSADLIRAAPTSADAEAWIVRTEPALVVAATDDEALNEAIEDAARACGVLVNRADRAGGRDAGSVVVPATVRDGPVTVAVSTGGTSPALSAYLRERVAETIDGAGAMAELTAELRADLKARDVSPGERREALRAVVRSSQVWKALHSGHANGRREAERVIRDLRGEP